MRANRVVGLLAPLCVIGAAVFVAPAALASGMNGKIAFVINPDGTDDEISVMNNDGSNPVQITNNAVADNDPAYSPDGTQIAFARQNGIQYDIWVMNADGSGERQVVASTSSERYPSWSPDGRSIVYTRTLRGGGRDIWTARADGTNARSIISTPGFDSEPSWSPVGDKIAFVHADSPNVTLAQRHIWLANPDGSEAVQITSVGNNRFPSFSPDGLRIIFESDRTGGRSAIWTMDANGGAQTELIGGRGDRYPIYSPDGTKIAWRRSNDVFVANADASNPVRLTTGLAKEFAVSWQAIAAPDVVVTQVAQPTPALVNRDVTFVITVRNAGASASDPVTLTDTPPAGLPHSSVTQSAGSCSGGATITCSLPGLAPGGSVEVRFVIRPTSVGSLTNTVTATTATDVLLSNNTSSLDLVVTGASGDCTVVGSPGDDRLIGTGGKDIICGFGGNDVIDGLGGNDIIRGDAGNDRISGGSGADVISGGLGKDQLLGGAGNDRIVGGLGNDSILGGSGADRLFGGASADTIFGGFGNDIIEGNRGNDTLNGGLGSDTMNGGGGVDAMAGGPGPDKLNSRDRTRDVVDGGAGVDSSDSDKVDQIKNVERKKRT